MSPLLIVFGAALVAVLVEALVPAKGRRRAQVAVASLGLLGGIVACVVIAGTAELTAAGAIAVDGPGLFLMGTIAAVGLCGILLLAEQKLDSSGGALVSRASVVPGSRDDVALAEDTAIQTEVFPLALFALGGMMLFTVSNNLILMFIALEVLSLPLYLMAG